MASVGDNPDPRFEYANGFDFGDRAFIALRGSQCRGHVDREDGLERCPFQARYLMLAREDHGDIIGLCGHHVNDHWTDAEGNTQPVGRGVYQAGEEPCCAHVNGWPHRKHETAEDGTQEPESTTRCGTGRRCLSGTRTSRITLCAGATPETPGSKKSG